MTITSEVIRQTREHFAEISRQCIEGARAGEWHVNDLASYVEYHEQAIRDGMAGKYDHSLTFLQRAHWIATGECVALLPK